MTRKDCKDNKDEIARLDAVNIERHETAKKRVAHAINILKPYTWKKHFNIENLINDAAHAVNLIESAVEDMTFHCEWFDYDSSVCMQLDEACIDLGCAMTENDVATCIMNGYVSEALVKLSKVYATFIRWNDESVDRSEI